MIWTGCATYFRQDSLDQKDICCRWLARMTISNPAFNFLQYYSAQAGQALMATNRNIQCLKFIHVCLLLVNHKKNFLLFRGDSGISKKKKNLYILCGARNLTVCLRSRVISIYILVFSPDFSFSFFLSFFFFFFPLIVTETTKFLRSASNRRKKKKKKKKNRKKMEKQRPLEIVMKFG